MVQCTRLRKEGGTLYWSREFSEGSLHSELFWVVLYIVTILTYLQMFDVYIWTYTFTFWRFNILLNLGCFCNTWSIDLYIYKWITFYISMHRKLMSNGVLSVLTGDIFFTINLLYSQKQHCLKGNKSHMQFIIYVAKLHIHMEWLISW